MNKVVFERDGKRIVQNDARGYLYEYLDGLDAMGNERWDSTGGTGCSSLALNWMEQYARHLEDTITAVAAKVDFQTRRRDDTPI